MSEAGPSRGRPLLWVVCGAGRGVGKTHLARALCQVLPGSAYAKQGASQARAGKAESFFHTDEEIDAHLARAAEAGHRHLVVESNSLALRGKGDIVIFLGGEVSAGAHGPEATGSQGHRAQGGQSGGHHAPRGARPDAGRLRSLAQVVLDPEGPPAAPAAWNELLKRKGLEPEVVAPVLEVLAAQAEWTGRARE